MKTKIYITLLTILFTVNTFAQSKVEELKIASKELNQSRKLMEAIGEERRVINYS